VIVGDNVGNPVMTIQENTDFSFLFFAVCMTKFGEIAQKLSFVIDAGNDFLGSGRVYLVPQVSELFNLLRLCC